MAAATSDYECFNEPLNPDASEPDRARRPWRGTVLGLSGILLLCTLVSWRQLTLSPISPEIRGKMAARQQWHGGKAKASLADTNLMRNTSKKGDCDMDTGGTCHVMGCNGNRGPTACQSGHCLCRPNYCNIDGRCEPDASSLCQSHTGGTCHIFNCGSYLGPTVCNGGQCECQAGYCADINGVCHPAGECSEETGGTCRVFNCHEDRGPTRCFNGMCICYPGYCSHMGMCILNQEHVNAYVWPVNQTSPTYPKSAVSGKDGNDVSIALSVSGGGSRSLSFTLGVLRALEEMGLMAKFDAISSVSGGTWAMAIYMFAHWNHNDKDLLGVGTSTPTSALTIDALKQPPPVMGQGVTGTMRYFVESLATTSYQSDKLWIDYVNQIILAPVGLDSSAFMAGSQQDYLDITKRNPGLAMMEWKIPRSDRAGVFVMNGAIMSPQGYANGQDDVVSLQMSPDWVGSPFFPDGKTKNLQYELQHEQSDLQELKGKTIGGGFVESFAFGSSVPDVQYGDKAKPRQMSAPGQPFGLPNAVGISSCALAGEFAQSAKASFLDPHEQIWPVTSEKQKEMGYELGDGGMIENGGVLAMMQRQAKKIVWLINTDTGLLDDFDWCGQDPRQAGFDPNDAPVKITNQVSDKFGHGTSSATGYLANNQVFAKDELADVACALQKLKKSGAPAVLQKTQKVIENTWWGIRPYEVEMVYVYLERSMNFEHTIKDQALRDEINKGATKWGGLFNNYPFFKTTFQNGHTELTQYTNEQVNLLAALGEYYIQTNRDLFTKLLGR